ncbi:MAG: cytochrome c3 family protein [Phycisphaerae bacterium]
MNDRWPSRPLTVGIVVAAAASGLLLAQVLEKDDNRPTTNAQAPVATTRPAETTPSGEAPAADANADDAARKAARSRLLSGLIGSKHDFTEAGENGRNLCLPCHTPHLVSAPVPRFDRRPTTTQPLRPYQGVEAELDGWSLLCLGCHDGVTAPGVYSTSHAATVAAQLANSRLGSAGLQSHPVGTKYPTAAEGYHPLAAVEAAGLMLPDQRIQCATCHDPHNTHRHRSMLRISNERSRMCLTCHRL